MMTELQEIMDAMKRGEATQENITIMLLSLEARRVTAIEASTADDMAYRRFAREQLERQTKALEAIALGLAK